MGNIPLKAEEWFKRGHEANNPLDAFNHFWVAFNNLYSSQNGRFEPQKIKNYLSSHVSEDVALELLERHSDKIDFLISQPVKHIPENGQDTQGHVDAYTGSENPIDKLKSIFMIIYQIRCNLIHGQKSPSRERDVELCNNSCGILSAVIELCL